jgi:D-amino-acid dehydrogenase
VTGFREHYLVPWPDGRVMAGATREADAGVEALGDAIGTVFDRVQSPRV